MSFAVAIALAVALVATLDADSLRAERDAPVDSDVRSALATKQVKRSLQRYTEEVTRLATAAADDDLLGGEFPRSLRKRNIRPFVINAAVGDGKIVFARTTRSISFLEAVVQLGALPVEVIERDIATGTETVLFKSRLAAVGGLRTRAGTSVFATAKLALGRRSLSYDSSLLAARPGSDGAKVIASEKMRIDIDKFAFCGSIIGSTTLDQVGAVLLSRATGTCSLVNEVNSERRVINPDGSESTPTFAAAVPLLDDSVLQFESGKLLSVDAETSSAGLSDDQNAAFVPLLNGEVGANALAQDGTVAAIVRNEVTSFPGQSEYPTPLVVFPQGDPDRMVVASRMAGKVRHVQFCAEHLYVVKRISNVVREFRLPTPGISFDWMSRSRAAYRVLLYDRNGALVKNLGDTPKMVLSAVGCEGGNLNLLATRGNNATLLRYTP